MVVVIIVGLTWNVLWYYSIQKWILLLLIAVCIISYCVVVVVGIIGSGRVVEIGSTVENC